MIEFSVSNLSQGAIQYLYSLRSSIWLDPPYQRMSDIWSKDKRQLLVDSVINGFDIPKLYFHELVPARKGKKQIQKYAIIDGKQRLDALWGFMDGKFSLADDFEYLHDDKVDAAGLSYRDLAEKYPHLKAFFDATTLSVVAIRTDDIELIEDMFSRLNEAVPLNAPEKRNAFGGSLPPTIRSLSQHHFFTTALPFADVRYKHRDLAAKFLLIEKVDAVTDTKKVYLDDFVRSWAAAKRTNLEAEKLRAEVESHLDNICDVFIDNDPLLRSIGMTLVIFHYFRLLAKNNGIKRIRREHFRLFEIAREANRLQAQEDITEANYNLLEFDKYVQTPNDSFATKIRLGILVNFMEENGGPKIQTGHQYYVFDF